MRAASYSINALSVVISCSFIVVLGLLLSHWNFNVCFVVRRGLKSAESARGNRLQGSLSVQYLMSANKTAVHWSLLIAHCSLLIAHWSFGSVPTTSRPHTAPLVRSLPCCHRTNATRARITAGLTSARRTQDARKTLVRRLREKPVPAAKAFLSEFRQH